MHSAWHQCQLLLAKARRSGELAACKDCVFTLFTNRCSSPTQIPLKVNSAAAPELIVFFVKTFIYILINYWILFCLEFNNFVLLILFEVRYILICLLIFLWVFYSRRIEVRLVSSIWVILYYLFLVLVLLLLGSKILAFFYF